MVLWEAISAKRNESDGEDVDEAFKVRQFIGKSPVKSAREGC